MFLSLSQSLPEQSLAFLPAVQVPVVILPLCYTRVQRGAASFPALGRLSRILLGPQKLSAGVGTRSPCSRRGAGSPGWTPLLGFLQQPGGQDQQLPQGCCGCWAVWSAGNAEGTMGATQTRGMRSAGAHAAPGPKAEAIRAAKEHNSQHGPSRRHRTRLPLRPACPISPGWFQTFSRALPQLPVRTSGNGMVPALLPEAWLGFLAFLPCGKH